MIESDAAVHRSAAPQNGAPQPLKLRIEQSNGIVHHDEPAKFGLILEDIEQNRGQSIEFAHLGFGQIVLRDDRILLAHALLRPGLEPGRR